MLVLQTAERPPFAAHTERRPEDVFHHGETHNGLAWVLVVTLEAAAKLQLVTAALEATWP